MDETVQLPPKRRRSSILPRRSVAPPNSNVEPSVDTTSDKSEIRTSELQSPLVFDRGTEEESHLEGYIKCLTTEQEIWKNLRAERKLLRNPENRITAPPQLSWDTAHEFLSEEDIALLKNPPPYEKMYEDYDRLVKEAAWVHNKYNRCYNLAAEIQRLVQARIDNIKKDIGEYSETNLDLPL